MNTRLGKKHFKLLACLLGAILIANFAAHAQHTERKLLKKVDPDYPQFLRERGIEGAVRVKVTVQADGKVREVQVVGGNPILAESAISAVKQWRYSPADGETIEEVVFNFHR